jgi:hypothetical protein
MSFWGIFLLIFVSESNTHKTNPIFYKTNPLKH